MIINDENPARNYILICEIFMDMYPYFLSVKLNCKKEKKYI